MNGHTDALVPPGYGATPVDDPTLPLAPIVDGPSRRGYAIASLIAVLGLMIGVSGLVRGFGELSDRVDSFQRVEVPGNGRFEFAKAGDFTVYYETSGTGGGEVVTVSLPPVRVTLVPEPGGAPIPIQEYGGSFDYSVGGHYGTALATFRIDTPGTYVLTAEAEIPPGAAQLAIGKGLGGTLARTIIPGIFLGVALIAAAIVAVVTAIRRRRARR